MKQASLSKWLKFILIGVGVCGLIVYALVLPVLGLNITGAYPEWGYCFWPWLIFLWCTAIPCFIALVFGWKIAGNIGLDRSFSGDNASMLKWISVLAAGDAAFFFLGNLVFFFLGMNHPSVVLASVLIVFAGVAVCVVAAALSHLVRKAADLQEQSDFTI